ncbi:MAG: DUF1963 domain-containing protein [Oscillospiraceae bacterium]|nr:DUF1963 domain-containing protein [Oscillospiraceae bacterium]
MEIPDKLKKYEEYLKSTEKPANEITFTRASTLPWESKCGGCPYLESDEDYPRDENGKPMMFLAQINLDEMPPLEDFPEHGLLQFYIGDDDMLGLDSACKVIYIPEYKKDASALLSENPFENDYTGQTPFTNEGKISFKLSSRFIGVDCREFNEQFEDKVSEDEWDALYELCYAEGSFVGGYPLFVQQAPAYYDDGTYDTVLLQLDCEDECGIMFGDSGNCNFFISKEDLKSRNFDNVEYSWQCC